MANIAGTSGNNAVSGTLSDDCFFAWAGNDIVAGGGYDVADHTATGVPIVLTLGTQAGGMLGHVVSKGGLGTDRFQDIAAFYGSACADRLEITAGRSEAENSVGLAGNVRFASSGGRNMINGWGGFDTVAQGLVGDSTQPLFGIAADLSTGGLSNTDLVADIGAVRESRLADIIIGNAGPNLVAGDDEIETLPGGLGVGIAGLQAVDDRADTFTLNWVGDAAFTQAASTGIRRDIEVACFLNSHMVFDLADPAAQVVHLHQERLGRAPDQTGADRGIETLSPGGHPGTLAGTFLGSPALKAHYRAANFTGEDGNLLHADAPGRSPEHGGQVLWIDHLAAPVSSMAEAMVRFSESPESIGISVARIGPDIWDFSESAEYVALTAPNIMPENTASLGIAFAT